jgi:transcriptional regulator with XRE-family HTH domain
MFGDMLRRDRERWGLSVAQAAWRFGVRPSEYREIEAGTRWPDFDTYGCIAELFGWPEAFIVGGRTVAQRVID